MSTGGSRSLSRDGVAVQVGRESAEPGESLRRGGLDVSSETPHMVTSGRYASNCNAFLFMLMNSDCDAQPSAAKHSLSHNGLFTLTLKRSNVFKELDLNSIIIQSGQKESAPLTSIVNLSASGSALDSDSVSVNTIVTWNPLGHSHSSTPLFIEQIPAFRHGFTWH